MLGIGHTQNRDVGLSESLLEVVNDNTLVFKHWELAESSGQASKSLPPTGCALEA